LRSEITEAQNARARRLPRTVSYLVAVSAALVAAFARYALDPICGVVGWARCRAGRDRRVGGVRAPVPPTARFVAGG